ncbi:response regulator [Paraburkholderia bengalensis]|uniref:Response regulator n=2 Tax=Paraburkholderia bengalensis TaxID=2747562 RepID=A0ABU8J615_9BURK
MRILLVDDDELLGSGVQAVLRDAGFTVDWTREAAHALISLTTTRYLLVVLEIDLPGGSGMELLKHLRQAGNHPATLPTGRRDLAR